MYLDRNSAGSRGQGAQGAGSREQVVPGDREQGAEGRGVQGVGSRELDLLTYLDLL